MQADLSILYDKLRNTNQQRKRQKSGQENFLTSRQLTRQLP